MPSEIYHPLFGRCAKFASGEVELLITLDVGPRIISCRYNDRELFYHNPDDFSQRTGWRLYGGHRLWHAPEAKPRTYHEDNFPASYSSNRGDVITLTTPADSASGIAKEISIAPLPVAEITAFCIEHRLTNRTPWPITLAPWAITVLAPGAQAIIPLGDYIPHTEQVLPVNQISLWGYTDLSDPRYTFVPGAVLLRQADGPPQKIGAFAPEGYAAAEINGCLFLKLFAVTPDLTYPDRGANVEVFTNNSFLELETLGALREINPEDWVTHTELWFLTNRNTASLQQQAAKFFHQVRHHRPNVVV